MPHFLKKNSDTSMKQRINIVGSNFANWFSPFKSGPWNQPSYRQHKKELTAVDLILTEFESSSKSKIGSANPGSHDHISTHLLFRN
jgi:hypothetical protein